jgi:hypothetical protein
MITKLRPVKIPAVRNTTGIVQKRRVVSNFRAICVLFRRFIRLGEPARHGSVWLFGLLNIAVNIYLHVP